MGVKTTVPMDNVKFLLIHDQKRKAFGNELEILIINEVTKSNGFWNAHTVSCGGVSSLEMAWIFKKILTFWHVLVMFTSHVHGKLIRHWNYFEQFWNYLKITQTQIKGIKSIIEWNSSYMRTVRFWYEFSGWVERLPVFSTVAEWLKFIRLHGRCCKFSIFGEW